MIFNYSCPDVDFIRIVRFVISHPMWIFGASISEILTINIPIKFETSFIRKDNVIYKIISACLNKFTKFYSPIKIFRLTLAHKAFYRGEICAFLKYYTQMID